MSGDHDLAARAHTELRAARGALLIDLEFTCWEDSLRTDWADPARPAEVIEIGLARYHLDTRTTTASFTSLVRPRVNPRLSDYCRDLLHIRQDEIDGADELPAVLRALDAWLRGQSADALPTCGWAAMDRPRLVADAARHGATDPLGSRAHVDLRAALTALLTHPTPLSRDELRAMKQLPPNAARHRALDDALDLTHFLPLLLDSPAPG